MQKFLIVTADDFGLHVRVNQAVERASREGVLTAASLMVGAPATADAVRRARALPELRVGLHLVLADGWSVLEPAQIPALVDAGGHFGGRMFKDGVRFFALPAVRRQLEAEIAAQFAAFARTGLPLDHVNAHKHFHLHPTVLGMLLRIGADYGLPAVRLPAEPGTAALLRPWLALMKRRLRIAGVPHNDRVYGLADSGALDEGRLLHILARLPPGVTEIYCHPATDHEGAAAGDAIAPSMAAYRHADELAALTSPRVRAAVAAAGALRGGYRDMLAARAAQTGHPAALPLAGLGACT